jgi:hypothetical protein
VSCAEFYLFLYVYIILFIFTVRNTRHDRRSVVNLRRSNDETRLRHEVRYTSSGENVSTISRRIIIVNKYRFGRFGSRGQLDLRAFFFFYI